MPGKILIVEDDAVTLDLLVRLIKAHGFTVQTADDGDAAIVAATTHRPDLVLCDVNLPTVNAHEVLQRLRAAPATRDIAVVALTASGAANPAAQAGVRTRILEMGFAGYIPKPVNLSSFAAEVAAYLPPHLR